MADADVLEAVRAARAEVKAERSARHKATILLAGSLILSGMIASTVTGVVVNRAAASRALENCELTNESRRGVRILLDGLYDLGAKRDGTLTPDQRTLAVTARSEGRALAEGLLPFEDCAARTR